jgi:hypothetical protein
MIDQRTLHCKIQIIRHLESAKEALRAARSECVAHGGRIGGTNVDGLFGRLFAMESPLFEEQLLLMTEAAKDNSFDG